MEVGSGLSSRILAVFTSFLGGLSIPHTPGMGCAPSCPLNWEIKPRISRKSLHCLCPRLKVVSLDDCHRKAGLEVASSAAGDLETWTNVDDVGKRNSPELFSRKRLTYLPLPRPSPRPACFSFGFFSPSGSICEIDGAARAGDSLCRPASILNSAGQKREQDRTPSYFEWSGVCRLRLGTLQRHFNFILIAAF